jgi:hypothetical protein
VAILAFGVRALSSLVAFVTRHALMGSDLQVLGGELPRMPILHVRKRIDVP